MNNLKFKLISCIMSFLMFFSLCRTSANAIEYVSSPSNAIEVTMNSEVTTSAAANVDTNIQETTNAAVEVTTSAAVTTGAEVTTKEVDTQVPIVPTNLIASSVTSTSCILSWTASTDNVGVTDYDIYNGATKIGCTTGDTTFEVTGLMPNTLYSFTVVAKDAAGNISEASSALSVTTSTDTEITTNSAVEVTTSAAVTTGAAATVDTQAPTDLTASSITSTSCILSWTASTDNVGVTDYDIYNGATKIGCTTGDTTFEVTGLMPNTLYSFTVVAKDAAGNISEASSILTVKTLAPSITISSNLKLTEDSIYQDVTITSGTLDLNGHKLTVNGNLVQTGGTIFIDGGQLNVLGDYTLSNSSYLQMTNSSDYVSVGGNFLMQSSNSHKNLLTAGILEVKENFTQSSNSNGNSNNFTATGTHKVILSGTEAQTVSFDDSISSCFNILEVNNANGIAFKKSVSITKPLVNEWCINGDLNLEGKLDYGDANVKGGLDLGGETITVNGNVVLSSGTINLNGGKLNINGSLTQTNGPLFVNGGQLKIAGDYTIPAGRSYLKMVNNADYISVGENFLMQAYSSHYNWLTAGTLEIKGNFTQKTSNHSDNFAASGSHKVILYGIASFDSTSSHFNELITIGEDRNTSDLDDESSSDNSSTDDTDNDNILRAANKIYKLYNLATEYKESNSVTYSADELVLQYIRRNKYKEGYWPGVAGKIDTDFVNYVDDNDSEMSSYFNDELTIVDPQTGIDVDLVHWAATLNVLLYSSSYSDGNSLIEELEYAGMPEYIIDDLGGWAGDLQTLVIDVINKTNNSDNYNELYESASILMGNPDTRITSFSIQDLLSDTDAVNINNQLYMGDISTEFTYYYIFGYKKRFTNFVNEMSKEGLRSYAYAYAQKWFVGPVISWPLLKSVNVTDNQAKAVSDAYTDFIWNKLQEEQ